MNTPHTINKESNKTHTTQLIEDHIHQNYAYLI